MRDLQQGSDLRLVPQTGRSGPANFHDAMDRALEWGEKIPIGLFYRNPHPPPSLDAQDPGLQSGVLVRQSLGMTREQRRKCIEEFM